MDMNDLDSLAVYNAERSRGIVHTREWVLRMAELQQQFDAEQKARLFREAEQTGGSVYEVSGGGWLVSAMPHPPDHWRRVEKP